MLETLTGIGPKTKQALSHLGIHTLEDFIEYYPYRYELIRRTNMEEAKEDDFCHYRWRSYEYSTCCLF